MPGRFLRVASRSKPLSLRVTVPYRPGAQPWLGALVTRPPASPPSRPRRTRILIEVIVALHGQEAASNRETGQRTFKIIWIAKARCALSLFRADSDGGGAGGGDAVEFGSVSATLRPWSCPVKAGGILLVLNEDQRSPRSPPVSWELFSLLRRLHRFQADPPTLQLAVLRSKVPQDGSLLLAADQFPA